MYGPLNTQIPSDLSAAAEERARLYVLLASVWRYPDDDLLAALRNFEDCGIVPAPGDGFSNSVNAALLGLAEACAGLKDFSASAALARLRGEHARLFGHSVRGSCPPYELEYGRSEIIQQTAELADLSGFYTAFGMDVQESACERGDHICVQCEFLSVLCVKQSWGLREGHHELAEACAYAQRLFLRDHLARWSPALAQRVSTAEPDGFYGCVAALTSAWIEAECRQFGIPAGPAWLELRPADPEQDAAIDCHTGECAAAAERPVQIGLGDLSTARSAP
jgi:TorA maturation chaperone TorD